MSLDFTSPVPCFFIVSHLISLSFVSSFLLFFSCSSLLFFLCLLHSSPLFSTLLFLFILFFLSSHLLSSPPLPPLILLSCPLCFCFSFPLLCYPLFLSSPPRFFCSPLLLFPLHFIPVVSLHALAPFPPLFPYFSLFSPLFLRISLSLPAFPSPLSPSPSSVFSTLLCSVFSRTGKMDGSLCTCDS